MMKNFDKNMLEALGYRINDRRYKDLTPLFSEDYINSGLCHLPEETIYSGAEHTLRPKLPNITVLPNLVSKKGIVLGTTYGHQHTQYEKQDTRPFQEIYEFQGYGAMFLRDKKSARLYFLEPREKAIIGTGESMTIINLDLNPLITLDYANPKMNSAHKNLENEIKCPVFLKYASENLLLKVNSKYYEHHLLRSSDCSSLEIKGSMLGEELFSKLKNNFYNEEFKKLGIAILFGSNLPLELKKELEAPLLELVLNKNKVLFSSLGME